MHHTWLCIMPCVCGGCLLCCLFLSGLLLSLASVSFQSCEDSFDYVRLSSSWTRSSSLWDFRQDDHTLDITTIFAMLVCSLLLCQCYDAYHLLVSLPNCHVKPLTHHVLANRWLAMLPLCSAPLIALLVAGEVWSRSLLGHLFTCWDIIILLCYLNASIYLVKGGRLGLSPSVLFHSCRPSFCHIGVMFPDFAFLTQLGYNGNPLIFRLD